MSHSVLDLLQRRDPYRAARHSIALTPVDVTGWVSGITWSDCPDEALQGLEFIHMHL